MMKNISICTTLKNRSIVHTDHGTRYLFLNFLNSIKHVFDFGYSNLELIVSDFGSTDIPNLYDYIKTTIKDIPFHIVNLEKENKFNRGLGLNKAISFSSHDYILILDVDMIFNENLINNCYKYVIEENKAYFPICYTFENDPSQQNGFWLDVAYGNFSMSKKNWLDAGKIPEYNRWGEEDLHFYEKLTCSKIREKCDYFIHQWHPNDIEWKNRFY